MADESGAAPYPVRMARPEILAGTPAIRCLVSVRNIVMKPWYHGCFPTGTRGEKQ